MFKIKKATPMFTGIITTAVTYKGDMTTANGLILDTTRMEGTLNTYQTVIAVGSTVQGVEPGDVVKINYKRYAMAQHTPGNLDAANNKMSDNMSITYEIPMIVLDGKECLLIQNNDVEYYMKPGDFEVDEGGLLQ